MPHSTARIALAGEYLAASYMLRYCDSVIMSPSNHRSDLILDHQGKLYRVQVKTTNKISFCWEVAELREKRLKELMHQKHYVNTKYSFF